MSHLIGFITYLGSGFNIFSFGTSLRKVCEDVTYLLVFTDLFMTEHMTKAL